MTYNELSKELGISSSFINQMMTAGLLTSSSKLLTQRDFSDDETKTIKRCALLKQLSYSWGDITDINSGTKDFSTSLAEHVTRIVNDSDNISQAAIVLQNIKREKEDFFSFDPEPYLQHIRDLKRNSGVFYDVNSSQLPYAGRNASYSYGEDRNHQSDDEDGTDASGHILWGYKDYRRSKDNPPNFGQPGYDYTQNTRRPDSDLPEKDTESDNNAANADADLQDTGSQDSPDSETDSPTDTASGYASFDSFGRPRKSPEQTCPHPIRRYIARIVDSTICTTLLYLIFEVILRFNLDEDIITLCYVTIFAYVLEFLTEPLLISYFGTTVGKWLMGISLRDTASKEKLSIKASYARVGKLLWYGFGAYLPIYNFIREIRSMLKCTQDEVLEWDTGIDYVMKDLAVWRIFACLALAVVLTKAEPIINYQLMIPSNRGYITEAQFYENCEEVMKDMKYTGGLPPFKITTESGYVQSVELAFSVDDTVSDHTAEMNIAFRAFAACSLGSTGYTLSDSNVFYYMTLYQHNFDTYYNRIHITNTVTGVPDSVANSRVNDIFSLLVVNYPVEHVFTLTLQ